jgi:hypothetical protein
VMVGGNFGIRRRMEGNKKSAWAVLKKNNQGAKYCSKWSECERAGKEKVVEIATKYWQKLWEMKGYIKTAKCRERGQLVE